MIRIFPMDLKKKEKGPPLFSGRTARAGRPQPGTIGKYRLDDANPQLLNNMPILGQFSYIGHIKRPEFEKSYILSVLIGVGAKTLKNHHFIET